MGPQVRGTQFLPAAPVGQRIGRVPSTTGGPRESPALTSLSSLPVISCQCPLGANPTRKAEDTGTHQHTVAGETPREATDGGWRAADGTDGSFPAWHYLLWCPTQTFFIC